MDGRIRTFRVLFSFKLQYLYLMIKSYKIRSFLSGLSFSVETGLKKNKWKLIFTFILMILGIVGGVVVATKTNVYDSFKAIQEIDVSGFEKGVVASASAFLSRSFSLLFNVLLLTVCSFTIFTMPLAQLLLVYRSYLFGLNFALFFVFYGFGSALTAIVVILPCQIITLVVMAIFYFLLLNQNIVCKKYGTGDFNRVLFVLLGFLLLFLINILETVLLLLLNGKVILVL